MYFKIRVFYKKRGIMRYISHLDLYRLFMRALRRADLPFYLTKGFNPRPRISFKRAHKLGEEVEDGEVFFYLRENIPEQEFIEKMNRQLPPEIRIYLLQKELSNKKST